MDQKTKVLQHEILLADAQDIGYGQHRKRLQDACAAQEVTTASGKKLSVGLVADGVGGASAGHVASQIVKDEVFRSIQEAEENDIDIILENALLVAQQAVRDQAGKDSSMHSMSSTATLAAISSGRLYLAHVGDSRAYLVRDGKIRLLTLDHTWGNEMIRQDRFSADEVSRHPKRTDLGRYIGQPMALEVDLGIRAFGSQDSSVHPAKSELLPNGLVLQTGDVVVLCTDGLIKERRKLPGHYVEPDEIVKIAQRKRNAPADTANSLISLALGRQTDDNVSVVVMEVAGGKPSLGISIPKVTFAKPMPIVLGISGVLLVAFLAMMIALISGPKEDPTPTATQLLAASTISPVLYDTHTAEVVRGEGEYSLPDKKPIVLSAGKVIPAGEGGTIWVTQGVMELKLADGTRVFLDKDAQMVLEGIASPGSTSGLNQLNLLKGKALVQNATVTIIKTVQVDFQTNLQQIGSLVGLIYAPSEGNFQVDCLLGTCSVTGQLLTTELQGGSGIEVKDFAKQDERGVDYALWSALGGDVVPQPTATPEPTMTSTPTVTVTPTSTLPVLPTATATEKPKDKPTKTPTEEIKATDTPKGIITPGG